MPEATYYLVQCTIGVFVSYFCCPCNQRGINHSFIDIYYITSTRVRDRFCYPAICGEHVGHRRLVLDGVGNLQQLARGLSLPPHQAFYLHKIGRTHDACVTYGCKYQIHFFCTFTCSSQAATDLLSRFRVRSTQEPLPLHYGTRLGAQPSSVARALGV